MSTRSDKLWGIDLGGTKTELAVVGVDRPFDPVFRARIPTEREQGYEHILSRIELLIGQAAAELGERPAILGIGHPGSEDPRSSTFKNSNTTELNGRRVRVDLEARLGIPLRMANDANCFALAESMQLRSERSGADRTGVDFGVILGTGVGGGIVIDGRVWNGLQGIAGEWGHNILDPNGEPCYCGRRGCVETVISGPALERFYERRAGTKLRLDAIVAAARAGTDESATATLEHLIMSFGRAIAVVINLLDPSTVILGGGVSNIDELYTEGRDAVRSYVFNPSFETVIRKHALGDSAGVFGAALLSL